MTFRNVSSGIFQAATFFALCSCSSLPPAVVTEAGRELAAIDPRMFDAKLLHCLKQKTSVFRSRDQKDEPPSFDTWVDRIAQAGEISRSRARWAKKWSLEERRRALSLALAQSFAYSQDLKGEFKILMDQGISLDEIERKGEIYPRLRALYFVKSELIDVLLGQLRDELSDAIEKEGQSARERGLSGVNPVVVSQFELARFQRDLRMSLTERVPDTRYASVALDEIETELGHIFAETAACFPPTIRLAVPTTTDVAFAARTLPKRKRVHQAFEPSANAEFGFSVEQIVSRRVRNLRESAVTQQPCDPRDTGDWGTVFFPTIQPQGNVVGTSFPPGAWALTFDDGPAQTTSRILASLASHDTKATFFILSNRIGPRGLPNTAVQEHNEGHAVASHSYTHPQFLRISQTQRIREVNGAGDAFETTLEFRPRYFRLPYGEGVSIRNRNGTSSPGGLATRTLIACANMVHVYWSVDTLDWATRDPDELVANTIRWIRARRGGVILFHDIKPQTVQAIDRILDYLKEPSRSLRTVTIPDIVDEMNGIRRAPPAR